MLLPNPEAVGTLLFVEDVGLELLAVVLPHFGFDGKSNFNHSTHSLMASY